MCMVIHELCISWRCHNMEMLSTLLSLCEGNSLGTGGFRWERASNSNTKLWCFLWRKPEQFVEQAVLLPVIWDAFTLMWKQCDVIVFMNWVLFVSKLTVVGLDNLIFSSSYFYEYNLKT